MEFKGIDHVMASSSNHKQVLLVGEIKLMFLFFLVYDILFHYETQQLVCKKYILQEVTVFLYHSSFSVLYDPQKKTSFSIFSATRMKVLARA